MVLDLVYEARDIDQRLGSQGKIDAWFDAKTKGLNDWQKDELRKKWGTMQSLLSSRSRMERVVSDIVFDFSVKPRLSSERGNAILVASSIYEATKYLQPVPEDSVSRQVRGGDVVQSAGAVRTRPCFPTRSTMHQRPSRCWTCANVSAATSEGRNPQPSRTARMARSRRPLTVEMSGVLSSVCAWRCDSQFPTRMPTDFTLFTRLIPAASSAESNPLSAASAASLRTADIRMMIDEDPSPRSSSDTRHACTVALLKPGRGACWNHSINSFSAILYTRFVIGEETLSRTSAFTFSPAQSFLTSSFHSS